MKDVLDLIKRAYADASDLLFKAAVEGDVENVNYCIRIGIDLDKVDVFKKTALYYAAQYNKPEVARLLIQAGANPKKGRVEAVVQGILHPAVTPEQCATDLKHTAVLRVFTESRDASDLDKETDSLFAR